MATSGPGNSARQIQNLGVLSSAWDALPREIKDKVLANLSIRDLRACRLLNRQTEMHATPKLFHTICMSPSMNSCARVNAISRHPTLRKHVQQINFCRWKLETVDGWFIVRLRDLLSSELPLQTFGPAPAALRDTLRSRASASKYYKEILSQREFRRQIRGTGLSLGTFQNLKAFTLSNLGSRRNDSAFIRPNSDIRMQTNFRDVDADGIQVQEAFRLIAELLHNGLPKIVQLEDIALSELRLGKGGAVERMLRDIETFKLVFRIVRPGDLAGNGREYQRTITRLESTFNLNRGMPSLKSLWFGFASDPSYDAALSDHVQFQQVRNWRKPLYQSILGQRFQKLSVLKLENFLTREADLLHFFTNHAKTLRSLSIKHMHVRHTDGILASMIRLADELRMYNDLTHVSFEGNFTDKKRTVLRCVPGNLKATSILYLVQEYICHRRGSPFVSLQRQDSWAADSEPQLLKTHFEVNGADGGTILIVPEQDASWVVSLFDAPRNRRDGNLRPLTDNNGDEVESDDNAAT